MTDIQSLVRLVQNISSCTAYIALGFRRHVSANKNAIWVSQKNQECPVQPSTSPLDRKCNYSWVPTGAIDISSLAQGKVQEIGVFCGRVDRHPGPLEKTWREIRFWATYGWIWRVMVFVVRKAYLDEMIHATCLKSYTPQRKQMAEVCNNAEISSNRVGMRTGFEIQCLLGAVCVKMSLCKKM